MYFQIAFLTEWTILVVICCVSAHVHPDIAKLGVNVFLSVNVGLGGKGPRTGGVT